MSSGFLRVRRKQYWRSSSVQTGDWHWHVAIKQCWELKQRAWPLQPGRTQWSNWTKAAPEMYAGQQWTRGQKQSIRCLGSEEGWGEGSRGEGRAVEGDGADVGAGKHQWGRRDFQAFGLFGLWGERWRPGLGAR